MPNMQQSGSERSSATPTRDPFARQIPPTAHAASDKALAVLQAHKDTWACLPLSERVRLLESLLEDFGALADEWVAVSLTAKRSHGDAYATGMEWVGGPMVILRYLRRLHRSLCDIQKVGRPKFVGPVTVRADGQIIARTYPQSLYERLTTIGITADVWIEPGQTLEEFWRDQAAVHHEKQPSGRVVLVLGAGNVSGIPVDDSLSKLFVENKVVLLKMNPVNQYLGPLIEKGFRRLTESGFVRVTYGGATEGAYLCQHPCVDEIHMTGSDRSYEAIVFGAGAEGQRRKEQHQPVVTKPFTAELGNVGPAIIVPGPWSQTDIRYQAEQIVSQLCDSNSYSCSRARVVIQHSDWKLRQPLLDAIRSVLGRVPTHPDYYPGSGKLYDQFVSAHPETEFYGSSDNEHLPWGFIPNLSSAHSGEMAFTTESFCPIVTETSIEALSTAEFIERAVKFSNDRLWGTLSASIVVHPRTLRHPTIASAVDRAIADLRYGTVAVNCLPGMNWLLASTPWGSYPGNPSWDIQSGAGFVHNALMFSRPQKTVVRAPFRAWPWPIWFPSRVQALAPVTKRVAEYERKPSWRGLLSIIGAALR